MSKLRSILFIIIGIVSIIFAVQVRNIASRQPDTGIYVARSVYGGDAYTGMQNASASTANNVRVHSTIINDQTKVIAAGFSYLFWLSALGFITLGVTGFKTKRVESVSYSGRQAVDEQLARDLTQSLS